MTEPTYIASLLAKLLSQDPKKEADYYEQLGRFIAAYSSAESQIHVLARHYLKTDDARARIVLGGQRTVDIVTYLRALMRLPDGKLIGLLGHVSDPANRAPQTIEICLVQFQIITQQRHKLIHRNIFYTEDEGFTVSNGQTAKDLMTAELRLIFTRDDLRNMTLDCVQIFLALAALTDTWGLANRAGPAALASWRYIPPPQVPQTPKRPSNRKEQRRQRRASRQSPKGQ